MTKTPRKKLERQKEYQKEKRHEKPFTYAEGVVVKMMPKEGTRVGIKDIGMPVKQLADAVGETSNYINGLIRSLLSRGHVVMVDLIPRNQGTGYQRTARGEAYLNDWESEFGNQDQRQE